MPVCERTCTTKNRMPELGSSGTVRGEGSNVLAYSDPLESEGERMLNLLSSALRQQLAHLVCLRLQRFHQPHFR